MDKLVGHERLVAFLRKHKVKMTEYIIAQHPKIEYVDYEWASAEVGKVEDGTLQGAGKVVIIEGITGNKIEKHSFRLAVQTNEAELSKLYLISNSFDLFSESRES